MDEKHFLPVAAGPHVSGPELDCLPWGQPAERPRGLRLRQCGPIHVLSRRECLRGGGQVGIEQEEGPSAGNSQDGTVGLARCPPWLSMLQGHESSVPCVCS